MIYGFIMLIKTVLVIITIIKTPCHARTIILVNILIVAMLRKIRSNENNDNYFHHHHHHDRHQNHHLEGLGVSGSGYCYNEPYSPK